MRRKVNEERQAEHEVAKELAIAQKALAEADKLRVEREAQLEREKSEWEAQIEREKSEQQAQLLKQTVATDLARLEKEISGF